MEICCTVCNWKYESGHKPCPVCHDTYIKWNEDLCQSCYDKAHPLEASVRKELAEIKKIKARNLKRALNKKAREKVKNALKNKVQGMRKTDNGSRRKKEILR
jgi:RecJ-like exonuclease